MGTSRFCFGVECWRKIVAMKAKLLGCGVALGIGCLACADVTDSFLYSGVVTQSTTFTGTPTANVGDLISGNLNFNIASAGASFQTGFTVGGNSFFVHGSPDANTAITVTLSQSQILFRVNGHEAQATFEWDGHGPDGLPPEDYRPWMPGFSAGTLNCHFGQNEIPPAGCYWQAQLTATSVPEPVSMAWLPLGLLVIARRRAKPRRLL